METKDLPSRALMPDLIRAFALFGICVVNVGGFAWPLATLYYDGGLETTADTAAYFGVSALFLMKSYPLFSMMFGAGLAYQMAAAARAQKDFAPRYFRRMAALMALGVLHFTFFWMGDILLTYGFLGCLLFTMRNAEVRTLVRTGIALIAVNTCLLALLAGLIWLAETYAPDMVADIDLSESTSAEYTAFRVGGFLDAAAYRIAMLPSVFPSVLVQQGIAVFGFFCFGLAAVKANVIDAPDAPVWRRARSIFLPVGIAGSAAGAWIMLGATSALDSRLYLGMAIIMAFSPLASLGYAGVIALAAKGTGPVRRFLAKAGSASLTAYILQSVALSLIFTGYGLGYYGEMAAAAATGTAAAVALVSLAVMGVWRSFAARGPLEVVLRRVSYLGKA